MCGGASWGVEKVGAVGGDVERRVGLRCCGQGGLQGCEGVGVREAGGVWRAAEEVGEGLGGSGVGG